MEWCNKNIAEKIEKMKKIHEPVVVWGLGDVCLLLLDAVPLDVVHYIDLDPSYKGQTIKGVPILDHCESDAPIVVMAQIHKEQIIEIIRKAGLPNKVITI